MDSPAPPGHQGTRASLASMIAELPSTALSDTPSGGASPTTAGARKIAQNLLNKLTSAGQSLKGFFKNLSCMSAPRPYAGAPEHMAYYNQPLAPTGSPAASVNDSDALPILPVTHPVRHDKAGNLITALPPIRGGAGATTAFLENTHLKN